MFFWLKQGAEQKLEDLREKGLVGDLKVETDDISGKKYVRVYEELDDPTSELPKCLSELTERVTAKERILRGLRTEGVYRHNGAILIATTGRYTDKYVREVWQWVNISGPSVEAVRAIYSLFRQGKLKPAEDYEAPQVQSEPKPEEKPKVSGPLITAEEFNDDDDFGEDVAPFHGGGNAPDPSGS